MLLSGNSYSFLVFSYSFLTCISSVSPGVVLDSCHSLCQCPGETTHGQHHLNALLPTAWCSSSASKPFLAHPWWTFQLTQPPQRGIFPKVWQKPHCLQQQFHLQSWVVHVLPPSSCSTVRCCSSTNSQQRHWNSTTHQRHSQGLCLAAAACKDNSEGVWQFCFYALRQGRHLQGLDSLHTQGISLESISLKENSNAAIPFAVSTSSPKGEHFFPPLFSLRSMLHQGFSFLLRKEIFLTLFLLKLTG